MYRLAFQISILGIFIALGTFALLEFWTSSVETQKEVAESSNHLISFAVTQLFILILYPLAKAEILQQDSKNFIKPILYIGGIVLFGALAGYVSHKFYGSQFQNLINMGQQLLS